MPTMKTKAMRTTDDDDDDGDGDVFLQIRLYPNEAYDFHHAGI